MRLALGLLLSLLHAPALAGDVILDFLDVGQGDSILIRGGGKTVLVDSGDRDSGVLAQLRALGVTQVDLAVGTHPHADHIGSMDKVIKALPVRMYMDSGMTHTTETYKRVKQAVLERGVHKLRAKTGMTIQLGDEATLHVLFPGETYLSNTRSDLNSNSVIIWLEHGEVDVLLTGDAEEPTEVALLRAGVKEVELLKVPHHGSSHSSSASFLARVSPEVAVISCGKDNRYGHPDDEALARLAAVGALVYRTDISGQIRAISNGTEIDVLEGTLSLFTARPPAGAQPPKNTPAPVETTVPEDVPSWLSGVRPTAPVVEETKKERKRRLREIQRNNE